MRAAEIFGPVWIFGHTLVCFSILSFSLKTGIEGVIAGQMDVLVVRSSAVAKSLTNIVTKEIE